MFESMFIVLFVIGCAKACVTKVSGPVSRGNVIVLGAAMADPAMAYDCDPSEDPMSSLDVGKN